jgi:hypothetical protein
MLCERLGGMTVREMLKRMDARELAEWAAYDRTNDEEWVKNHKEQSDDDLSDKILSFFR